MLPALRLDTLLRETESEWILPQLTNQRVRSRYSLHRGDKILPLVLLC